MKYLSILFLAQLFALWTLIASSEHPPLMSHEKTAFYRSLLPQLSNSELTETLQSDRVLFYDTEGIVPGYQDSLGDPRGFRPNTIDRSLINLAVPGGWERIFAKKGMFHFPFGTGGVDKSDNVVKINVWIPPMENGQPVPVALWRASFSRIHWLFPVGTRIGEILMVKFTDGDLRVFEVRIKTRTQMGWDNAVYRPFNTAGELQKSIQTFAPDWKTDPALMTLVRHLEADIPLTNYPLTSTHFTGTFSEPQASLDILPDFNNPLLVKNLLKNQVFQLSNNQVWKQSGRSSTYAVSTHSPNSIVPRNYEAGAFPITNVSCNRCHEHAGRQIGDFHDPLIAYGELWGEDQIFSWHPFETQAFLKPDGSIKNFNDDNRRIRKDFLESGLVKFLSPEDQSPEVYRSIPHPWKYTPFRERSHP